MRHKFYAISLTVAILGICICGNAAYAQETAKDLLTPDSLLVNSDDASPVTAISDEILNMANSFEPDGFWAELSDILCWEDS